MNYNELTVGILFHFYVFLNKWKIFSLTTENVKCTSKKLEILKPSPLINLHLGHSKSFSNYP